MGAQECDARSRPGGGVVLPDSVRILLIEDDEQVAADVVGSLSQRGYQVTHLADGREGLDRATSGAFMVIVCDRMLPGLDGISIIESLRGRGVQTPALILSAMGDTDNRVIGLGAGADDYLPKPFALVELAARVAALARRGVMAPTTHLSIADLDLDLVNRSARRGEREIELLPMEFKLLEYLMRHHGEVVSRAMLLQDVWHYNIAATTNVADVHVGKLRRKIDGDGETALIKSVRGKGFMLTADAE